MKKLLVVELLVVVLLLMVSGVVYAGAVKTNEVYVSSYGANGSIESARYSADTVQFIGCYTLAYSDGRMSGYCYAQDKAGKLVTGTTTDLRRISIIQSIKNTSYIGFLVNSSGILTDIHVINDSSYIKQYK